MRARPPTHTALCLGLRAATRVASFAHLCGDGRPVAAQGTPPPSRAVALRLTAKRSWVEAVPGRPDSAANRMLSPFPAQARPECGTKYGPVCRRARRERCVWACVTSISSASFDNLPLTVCALRCAL